MSQSHLRRKATINNAKAEETAATLGDSDIMKGKLYLDI